MTSSNSHEWGGDDDPFRDAWGGSTPSSTTTAPAPVPVSTGHEWGPGDPFYDIYAAPASSAAQQAPAHPAPEPSGATSTTAPRPSISRRQALILGGGVGALGLVGVVYSQVTGDEENPIPAAPETFSPINRPAAPGWSQRPVWRADAATASAIAVDHDRIALVTSNRELQLLNPSGVVTFTSAPQPSLSDQARPLFTSAAGRPIVAVLDAGTLYMWQLAKPEPQPVAAVLPPGTKLSIAGGGALVFTERSAWTLTRALRLASIGLPSGHVPLAVTPDGSLIAAPREGDAKLLAPGAKPRPAPAIKAPAGTRGPVHIAWAARGLLAVWWARKEGTGRVAGIASAANGRVFASAPVPAGDVAAGMPLVASPDGKLAAFGPVVVNTATGKVKVYPGLLGSSANSSHVYGTRNGDRVAVNVGGLSVLPAQTAIPWGVTSDGKAIVLDRDGQGAVVVALPRRG